MKLLHALGAGLAGAVVLTITHQVLRKLIDDAPRMDLMGEEALEKISDKAGVKLSKKNLYKTTMVADIIANSLYYALAAMGKPQNATLRASGLGLIAGIGGVVLPKPLRLTNAYSNRTITTRLLTMAIYSLGGLVSGKIASALQNKRQLRM